MNTSFSTGFSIVLCTYNGESRLEPTLAHIASLDVPHGQGIELVVVNNASTDKTASFVKEQWTKLGKPFALTLLEESRPGKGFAVETGYDAARLSYILTVDDDNWLQADYLVQAAALFKMDPAIGILQGQSRGVYQSKPPAWIERDNLEHYFVIGGPIQQPGYYPPNNYGVWGAGMIIKKEDWTYLRKLGFAFLTSKVPGKAAGEDHELAIALLMMGRKIFYSDRLVYQHYMPVERVVWEKLKQNFETYGYVSHYNFLYAVVLEACERNIPISKSGLRKEFFRFILKSFKTFTLKQLIAYWVYPQEQYYQLRMRQYFSHYKWFFRLSKNARKDLEFLQSWMRPILNEYPGKFHWPGKVY